LILTDDAVSLWTASRGQGLHLALAHGGPGLWDYLEPLADDLEAFAIVHRWDQRGGGRSDSVGPFTVARFVSDMDDVRRGAGVHRWVAGGHSWGANLALVYALTYPEFVRGVLYIAGAGLDWPRWRPEFRTELAHRLGETEYAELDSLPERERSRKLWTSDFANPELAQPHVRRMLAAGFSMNLAANRAVQADFEAIAPNLAEDLQSLQVPVLIIQGALDPRPLAALDSLVESLQESEVTRVVIGGAGHFPWAERRIEMIDLVERWLLALPG
jgi:proline iminopeptidase